MARFNNEIITDDEKIRENAMEECDVDFDAEDGYKEQKHVSVSWLDLVEK